MGEIVGGSRRVLARPSRSKHMGIAARIEFGAAGPAATGSARAGEIAFGPFRLLPEARLLMRNATPVRIGSRALDILLVLARRPGQTVTSEELIAAVWPGLHVETNTLRVHIATLRKLLAVEGREGVHIVSVTGRGYSLIAPTPQDGLVAPPVRSDREPSLATPPAAALVGRDALLAGILQQLRSQRLVTLVGPGGVGKTALACEIAQLMAGHGQEVVFVDFSALVDGELLTSTIAARLGLASSSLDATSTILRYMADRPMLLVLDTCEHVIGQAAAFAAAVLAHAPGVRLLATSREEMRVPGEHVRLVPGLDAPDQPSARAALECPAVRLFFARAMAASADLKLGEDEALAVAEVCRRLDGLPLAIELAAALVPTLGIDALARGLGDRFALLTRGYRTALPRHQTLKLTVEWSFRLLSETEGTAFRRLGILRGTVSLDDAVSMLAFDGLDRSGAAAALRLLAAKSLVELAPAGADVRCRVLDTNRDFALAELVARDEFDAMAARHAEHWAARLEGWSPDAAEGPARRMEDEAMLANVRAALDRCWSQESRHLLGVRLTLAAVPLWTTLSLIGETMENVGRALAAIAGEPADRAHQVARMRLHAALGGALMNVDGAGERVRAAWTTSLHLAEALDDTEARLRALWGLWVERRNLGNAREALEIAEAYGRLAATVDNPLLLRLADRMRGVSCFFVGRFAEARHRLESMLARAGGATRRTQIAAFQFDQTIAARCFHAQTLWLQGLPDQAAAIAFRNVEDALDCDHAGTLSYSLSEAACPIALRNGDLGALERCTALLLSRTQGPGLEVWHTLGRGFESLLMIHREAREAGLGQLGEVLAELRAIRHGPMYTMFLCEYALALSEAGRLAEAEQAAAQALARIEHNDELWYAAELSRVRGELAVRRGEFAAARHRLGEAIAIAREQGALAWELRAATSLARLCRDTGEEGAAEAMLIDVLRRGGEGATTRDVTTARAMLRS